MSRFEYVGAFPRVWPSDSSEHLSVVFSAGMGSSDHRWKNKNRSADFLSDYFANFFPSADEAPSQTATRAEMRSAIAFIANELLENAIKYNHDASCQLDIQLHLREDCVMFFSTNSIDPASIKEMRARTQELLEGDPSEMYFQQIERNAESDSDASGLGFLTMLNDYGTRLAWRFEHDEAVDGGPIARLTTMVTLDF